MTEGSEEYGSESTLRPVPWQRQTAETWCWVVGRGLEAGEDVHRYIESAGGSTLRPVPRIHGLEIKKERRIRRSASL